MLNLVWLKSFLTLVDTRSFQLAAERLGLAQPTVSQHIQKLEEQLGRLLFRRARSGCEPTPDALALLPYAQSLIRLNDRALAALQGQHLRLGASSNIGIYLLPPQVRRYLDGRGEDAGFDLVIDRNPAIAERLESGELDVALMEWWDDRPGFAARIWRREPVVLIVPPGHPWAGRSGIAKQELAGVPLLGGEPGTGTGRLLSQHFGEPALAPTVSLQLGSTEAVKQAVRAGLGISLVIASAVSEEVAGGRLKAIPLLDPGLSKPLFVVWRDSGVRHLPPPSFVGQLLAPEPAGAAC